MTVYSLCVRNYKTQKRQQIAADILNDFSFQIK